MEENQTFSMVAGAMPSLPPVVGKLSPTNKIILAEVFEQKQISTASLIKLLPRNSKSGSAFTNAVSDLTQFFTQQGIVVGYITNQNVSYIQSNELTLTPNSRMIIQKPLLHQFEKKFYISTGKKRDGDAFNLKEAEEFVKSYSEDGSVYNSLSTLIPESNWYLEKAVNHKILDKELVYKLIKDAQNGSVDARNVLIMHNQRLVVHIAHKFYRGSNAEEKGVQFTDVIQEGNFGLSKSIERFDLSLNLSLSTYAYWWISQSIRRMLQDFESIVRVPVYMQEKLSKYREVSYLLENKTGEKPDIGEIADQMNITVKAVQQLEKANGGKKVLSLDSSCDNETEENTGFQNLYATISNKGDVSAEKITDQRILKDKLMKALKTNLAPREYAIINRRFGLNDNKPSTLAEIGDQFGLSRERIRQLENKAFEKIRQDPDFTEFVKEYLEK